MLEYAKQLFDVIKPEDEVRAAAASHPLTIDFINRLVEDGAVVDAIRYLAVAITKRQAIWWSVATHTKLKDLGASINPQEDAAWSLVREWVYSPTEEIRTKALKTAEDLEFQTPGAYAALAVFWSGGSMLPPETGEMLLPPPQLSGTAVGASILLICASGKPNETIRRQNEAIAIGLDIARGGNGLERNGGAEK